MNIRQSVINLILCTMTYNGMQYLIYLADPPVFLLVPSPFQYFHALHLLPHLPDLEFCRDKGGNRKDNYYGRSGTLERGMHTVIIYTTLPWGASNITNYSLITGCVCCLWYDTDGQTYTEKACHRFEEVCLVELMAHWNILYWLITNGKYVCPSI